MKVLTFSRHFPKGHPKAGQPTYFVEKIEACLADIIPGWEMSKTFTLHEWEPYYNCTMPKRHTIRTGSRWSPGDMASLRVWSDAPYCSKQSEFAQVEIKNVTPIEISMKDGYISIAIDKVDMGSDRRKLLAANDGLEMQDFTDWFSVHPKKKGYTFTGQIICWDERIGY